MLNKFVASQATVAAQIQSALEANDWEAAERLTHTLKGLAGNIGAEPLQEVAGQLESALRDHETDALLHQLLTNTAQQLAALVGSLWTRLVPSANVMVPAQEINLAELDDIVSHLLELLAEDDAESSDYFSVHERLLQLAFPAQNKALHEAMCNYDFADAFNLLKEAAVQRQIIS